MISQRKKFAMFGIGAATALGVAMFAGPGFASHTTGFTSSGISLGVFGPFDVKADKNGKWDLAIKSHGQTDVRVNRVSFAAGASSNWHSHPGPNLLTVTVGAVTEYEGSDPLCPKTTYSAGETFGDNGGSTIHLVRNETGSPAEVIAVAFYPHATGTPPVPAPTVTKPRPTNCAAVDAPLH